MKRTNSLPIHNIYTIRQIGNGFLLTIHEDEPPITTGDEDYYSSVERLITHLANQLNLEEDEV